MAEDTKALEPTETESVSIPESLNEAVPCKVSEDEDAFWRQMRANESKDDLAIRIMNLPNDTHTDKLKEKASEWLFTRF